MKLEFSRRGFENTAILNFMKIRPVGAELFYTDGRTDMAKLTDVFRNFTNASKSERIDYHDIFYGDTSPSC